ncbi:DUF924-domain-containing protein [Trematosphaeria pertusa]|uniref:DUF924-domain-containing protein n=1 Tax=Trematosphaeria pertusa TaxID=390896 RepID=A0A6A6IUU0_9PLEO|nr:DUF924-domain-containing protein [Trematosphaeria pertusa]KAF2252953.1 DUF924-domain-containing protein [Trematosphaeria pertusa]
MSSFTLDKDIFNPTLYKKILDVWFEGHELGAKEINMDVVKRWFMGSPEEKLVFDGVCREHFGHALEAIGPELFPNPNAEPFVREIQETAQRDTKGDGSDTAWAALSIVLLLDQVPRNLFRTNEGLAKVYTHYDKISQSLVKTMLSPDAPIGRPDLHPQWRFSFPYRMWFYLPLLHSEDIDAHDMLDEIYARLGEDMGREEGHEAEKVFLAQSIKAEKEHRHILDKFGRYPHRNYALGREPTLEEKKYLEEGGNTFGVAQEKRGS